MQVTWSQVDFAEELVQFRGTASKNKRTRTVPLSPRAITWLRKLPRYLGSPYVFTNRLTRDRLRNPDKTLCRVTTRAGLAGVGFHDFRRYRATTWLRNGVDPETIRCLLGHVSLKTTQKYFVGGAVFDAVRKAQEREAAGYGRGNFVASERNRQVG